MWPASVHVWVCVCVGRLIADMIWRVVRGWHLLRNAFISTTHTLPQSCHWCRCSFIWYLTSVRVFLCVCVCARVWLLHVKKAAVPQLSVEKCVGVQCEGSRNGAKKRRESSSSSCLPPPLLIPPVLDLCGSITCGPKTSLILTPNTSAAERWWLNLGSCSHVCNCWHNYIREKKNLHYSWLQHTS